MKEIFEAPVIELIEFDNEDVITTSNELDAFVKEEAAEAEEALLHPFR